MARSLWDLITTRKDMQVLQRLCEAADLVPMLNTSSQRTTMFLPVDSAFEAFFNETGSNLTALVRDYQTLQDLLAYHTVNKIVTQSDLQASKSVMTKFDSLLLNHWFDGSILLVDQAGRTTDLIRTNVLAGPYSIAHIIDRVLMPFRPSTVDDALQFNTQFQLFRAALEASGNFSGLLNSATANVTLMVPTNEAVVKALEDLNTTFVGLLSNSSLLQSIISAHILPSVVPWEKMLYFAGARYFPTCDSCSTFYVYQDWWSGGLVLNGIGNTQSQTAAIVARDLVAGENALIQAVDAVMLPLKKWSKHCTIKAVP
jgi:uncharacterized surface protein with fasciclin (FAS1) repeats